MEDGDRRRRRCMKACSSLIPILVIISLYSPPIRCEDELNVDHVVDEIVYMDVSSDVPHHLFSDEDFEKTTVVDETTDSDDDDDDSPENTETDTPSDLNASYRHGDIVDTDKLNITHLIPPTRPPCTASNWTLDPETAGRVQLVNGSTLTTILSDSDIDNCFFVLFYVPWCPFSAKVAPIFNALPRAVPKLHALAFDVSNSVGYNTKFGTSAVPMLVLFQHKNVIGRFNYTSKNITTYITFIETKTGFACNHSVNVSEEDFLGPVPTVVEVRYNWNLLAAWIFLIIVMGDLAVRKTPIVRLIGELVERLRESVRRTLALPAPTIRPMIQHHSANNNRNDRHPHLE